MKTENEDFSFKKMMNCFEATLGRKEGRSNNPEDLTLSFFACVCGSVKRTQPRNQYETGLAVIGVGPDRQAMRTVAFD